MIPFLLKSTLCLILSFGIYQFLLQNLKAHVFNRFYLVFSLLFALVIPFISFETKVDLPVNAGIEKISNYTENYVFATEIQAIEFKKENISVTQALPKTEFRWQYVLYALYFIVSLVLLFRFVLNLYRIFRTIRKSEKIDFQHKKLVLVPEKILPYSFFHFIFLYNEEYKSGEIGNQLLAHECAHCRQLHSLDILLVEILKIVFWFNPALWLYRKAIQLNHEFLADESVIEKHELIDYQKLLLKIVFRNNSTYLASNFNYSLIKKRLIMMTKRKNLKTEILRKMLIIPVFVILVITLTFCQKETKVNNKPTLIAKNEVNYEKEWWYKIVKKHSYAFKSCKLYDNVVFLSKNEFSEKDSLITIKSAFILQKINDSYTLITSELVILNKKTATFTSSDGLFTMYPLDDKILKSKFSWVYTDAKFKITKEGKYDFHLSSMRERHQ